MEENLRKLQALLSLMEKDHLGKEDFAREFAKVLQLIQSLKQANAQAMAVLTERINLLGLRLKENNQKEIQTAVNSTQSQLSGVISGAQKTIDRKVGEIDRKLGELKDGKDGKDADEIAVANRVADAVKQPIINQIEKDIPRLGEAIRDALELLQGNQKLDINAIRGLTETLNALKNTKSNNKEAVVAGIRFISQLVDVYIPGIANGQVLVWNSTNHRFEAGNQTGGTEINFADSEAPTGTINGANTDFVLANTPTTGSLKVYVNGMRYSATEDYTLSTKTITFLNAPGTGSIITCDYRY